MSESFPPEVAEELPVAAGELVKYKEKENSQGPEKRTAWPQGSIKQKILKNVFHQRTPRNFLKDSDVSQASSKTSLSERRHHRYRARGSFFHAVKYGFPKRVQMHIDIGFSVNKKDWKRRTPLHYACAFDQVPVVSMLLDNNCNVNSRDWKSITPLIVAAHCGHVPCVCLLLDKGADVQLKDKYGHSPFIYALCGGHYKIVELLLDSGADIEEISTKLLLTPLLLALREKKKNIAMLLINKGANVFSFDVHKRNSLIYAVRCNSTTIVKLLIDRGVDIEHRDKYGWTALRYAIEGQELEYSLDVENTIEDLEPVSNKGEEYTEAHQSILEQHDQDPNIKPSIKETDPIAVETPGIPEAAESVTESEPEVLLMKENMSDHRTKQEEVNLPETVSEDEECNLDGETEGIQPEISPMEETPKMSRTIQQEASSDRDAILPKEGDS